MTSRFESGRFVNYCPYCEYSSIHNKGDVIRHINTVHTLGNTVSCSICEHLFKNSYSLKKHMKRKHTWFQICYGRADLRLSETGLVLWECKFCSQISELDQHISSFEAKHIISSGYPCSYCDKILLSKNAFLTHVPRFHRL